MDQHQRTARIHRGTSDGGSITLVSGSADDTLLNEALQDLSLDHTPADVGVKQKLMT